MEGQGLSGLWLLLTEFINSDAGAWVPVSPFKKWVLNWDGWNVIRKYLAWVNWFIPISTLIDIMIGWLAAIAAFYAIMAILRWMKIVGD